MNEPKRPITKLRRILPDLIVLPCIALLLSSIMAWSNVGFGDEFLSRWARGFGVSIVLLPLILACLGAVERGVESVVGGMPRIARKLTVALVTAGFIESVLALAVTLLNASHHHVFADQWWAAFSRSYPAGFAISAFFVFYMKPKMERMRAATT